MYVGYFPHRFVWRFGMLLILVGLSFLHWLAIPFAILMAQRILKYIKGVREHFVSGLVAPAKILSLNPPRLAVYSDLSIGVNSCKVVRLMDHPLERLPAQFAKLGKTSTVCMFFGMYPGLSKHWFTPLPVMPHFVTKEQVELDRILASISAETWNELESGIKQLPANAELRTYRVIRPDFHPRLTFSSDAELTGLVRKFMTEADVKIGPAITGEVLSKVNKNLTNPVDTQSVVGVCDCYNAGVVFMSQGLLFYSNEKPISIPWNKIKVAYTNMDCIEIVSTKNQRLLIKNGCTIKTLVVMTNF